MAVKEHWFGQDLSNLVTVVPLMQTLDSAGDGDLIGVKVTDHGLPAALSGTVRGYVTGADGVTRKIQGAISNTNQASFRMTNAAYEPGQVSILIKLENGSNSITLAACTGFIK